MQPISKWLPIVVLLALAMSELARAVQRKSGFTRAGSANDVVPNRFIVEFENPTGLKKRAPNGDHIGHFYHTLKTRGIGATPQINISSEVFEGVSFTTDDTTKIEDLEKQAEVKAVWHARLIPKPEPQMLASGDAAQKYQWNSHQNTGVLDLHEQGIQGEGAVVAIIDTGIDYTHPLLGGGIGSGRKVLGGTDVVGNDYVGKAFYPDSDPLDIQGHGTHVAGIISASENSRFVSVAPKAKLRAYKVFGNEFKYTADDALIMAMTKAYDDGVDVINVSVGGPGGWTQSGWAAIASRIASQGVFVSVSAGNSGQAGVWYPNTGASGIEATTVASIETENYVGWVAQSETTNGTIDVTYLPSDGTAGFQAGTFPVYATSADTTILDDACSPLPSTTPNLSKHLVLVRRGTCEFAIKEAYLTAKGAQFIWVYNQGDRSLSPPGLISPVSKGYAMISAAQGELIITDIKAKKKVTVTFPDPPNSKPVPNASSGGLISPYSSWGPTWEGYMKPEIAAPGGAIYSTLPSSLGSYGIASGTSMSAPYIAGVAALYIGKAGGRKALGVEGMAEVKRRILTAGEMVPWSMGVNPFDSSKFAPVSQQGAGYINAKKVFYSTVLSPGKLELNDTTNFKSDHVISIENTSGKSVVYTISHEPAGTVFTYNNQMDPTPAIFPPVFAANNQTATLQLSHTKLSVGPRTKNTFEVTFTPPDLPEWRLPLYSGKIVISGDNNEVLSIPYLGVKGSFYNSRIWNTDQSEPAYIIDGTSRAILGPVNFTFAENDLPATVFFNYWGTQEMRWDVVQPDWEEKDWKYPPKEGEAKYVGSVVDNFDGTRFPQVNLKRVDPVGRNYFYNSWAGELTNGTKITKGTYNFVWRTLRVGGNREKNADWQVTVSPPFTIVQKT